MKAPKLPAGRSSIGKGTGGGSDVAKLIFLSALMLIFIVGFIYFRYTASTGTVLDEEGAGAYIADNDLPIKRVTAAKVNFKLLSEVRDSTRTERLIREPEPYAHLLAEARNLAPGDLEVLGLRSMDAAAIHADPALHRGQPFEVRGFLESIEVVQGQVWEEIRGTIREPSGQLYAFSVLREPDVQVGQVVRLKGFFFKLFSLETAPGEYADAVIYLIGKSLIRSFLSMDAPSSLDEIPFDEARDFDITDMVELQEEILYPVLNYARGLSDEERAAIEPQDVTWAELRKRPDQYRGTIVRILARYVPGLEWPRQLGPEGENPLDVRFFHDGILALPNERLIRWIGIDPFPQPVLRESKLAYMTGVFVKNYAWENNRGQILNGPMLVPIRFEPFVMPSNEAIHQLAYVIGGVTLFLIVAFFLAVFHDSRKAAEFRREFLVRKKRRLSQALREEAPTEAKPPDVTAGT